MTLRDHLSMAACTVAAVAASLGAAHAQGSGSATLDAAKARGQLACGVAGGVPGSRCRTARA